MLVLTGREFRVNQSKYFGATKGGEDVVIKSRASSFRIVPVTDDDIVVDKDELAKSLYRSLLQIKFANEGNAKPHRWEETMHEPEKGNR